MRNTAPVRLGRALLSAGLIAIITLAPAAVVAITNQASPPILVGHRAADAVATRTATTSATSKRPPRGSSTEQSAPPAAGTQATQTSTTSTATASSSAPGQVIWNGDLTTGDLSQGWTPQACSGSTGPPKGFALVSSPARPGYPYAAALTVADNSTHANCQALGAHAAGPNAQLVGKNLFTPGMNVWIGLSVNLPSGFPSISSSGFFQLLEIYGPPFAGSPPWGLEIQGQQFGVNASGVGTGGPNGPYGGAAWRSAAITYGVWHDFVFHENFATDNSGYLEVYYDGVQQRFGDGSTRIYFATLRPGVNWDGSTPNHVSLQQYRAASPAYGSLTVYETGLKVGTSYAAVVPTPAGPQQQSTQPAASPAQTSTTESHTATTTTGSSTTVVTGTETSTPTESVTSTAPAPVEPAPAPSKPRCKRPTDNGTGRDVVRCRPTADHPCGEQPTPAMICVRGQPTSPTRR